MKQKWFWISERDIRHCFEQWKHECDTSPETTQNYNGASPEDYGEAATRYFMEQLDKRKSQ